MSEPVINYEHTRQLNLEATANTFARYGNKPTKPYPRLYQFLLMSNRISALSTILQSPMRILGLVLMLFFVVEVAVMFVLPLVIPIALSDSGKAFVDAILLTLVCAPMLWLVIIGPLRRIAIQEHERSETIVANASESILTFGIDGRILSCNRAATDLFGIEMEILLGRPIMSLVPQLPDSQEKLRADYRVVVSRSDGQRLPIQVSVSEYPSESGPTRIAIIRDLTESEKVEEARISMALEAEALRAQQMTTLAQLATGVAHEIRNPLTSIKMLIQVNRAKFAAEGLLTDDLVLVEQEIRRMERSVNSLLDYARPETSEFKELAIQDAIRRTVQLIEGRCQAQNIQLVIEAPDTPLSIVGDVAQIQQLLLNLVLNALDAMPKGGRLTITATQSKEFVVVSVCDTGPGINDGVLAKLFAPFVTTKANGVGLGLGICKRIAEAHQSKLTGFNMASGGAKFQLTLPKARRHGSADVVETFDTDVQPQKVVASSPTEKQCKAC